MEFSSEGFDLDALEASSKEGVVYEIGGGATCIEGSKKAQNKEEKDGKDWEDDCHLSGSQEWEEDFFPMLH